VCAAGGVQLLQSYRNTANGVKKNVKADEPTAAADVDTAAADLVPRDTEILSSAQTLSLPAKNPEDGQKLDALMQMVGEMRQEIQEIKTERQGDRQRKKERQRDRETERQRI